MSGAPSSVPADTPFFQPPLQIFQISELSFINSQFESLTVNDPDSQNNFGTVAAAGRIMDALVVRFELMSRTLIRTWKNCLRNPDQRIVRFKAFWATWFGVFFSALVHTAKIKLKPDLSFFMIDESKFRPDVPAYVEAFDKLSEVP
jgi:hypothetical protein